MPDWLLVVVSLAGVGWAVRESVVWARKVHPPDLPPDSQLRSCRQPAQTNHIPDCCRDGVHSPFWDRGFACRYCGAPSLVEPEPPTVPDHLWKPGA